LLQEKEVFREIIRLIGLGLLVYGIFILAQIGLSFFLGINSGTLFWLVLTQPVIYVLVGLYFLMRPASVADFAYPRNQLEKWSYQQVFTMGVKLCGLWLILVHLTGFQEHLRYYLGQIPMVGRYQVITHDIWTAAAIYAVFIVAGVIMLRYQPDTSSRSKGKAVSKDDR